MRVAIDARSVMDRKSGIGNTVDALVRHMVPLAEDVGVEFLLLRHPQASQPIVAHPRVLERVCRGETKSVHTVFSVGRALRREPFDVYHACADLVPLGLAPPWVVTIHDLMWLEAPRLASAFWPQRLANSFWYRTNITRAVRGARRVVAVSEATRDAIGRVYPDHVHKVRVVRHGIDLARYRACHGGPRSLLDAHVPPGACFSLIVGQGSPYKNHAAMVRAFMDAVGERSDHKLVLVRRFARIDPEMHRLLRSPEARRLVVALPHVSDEILFALYTHARMLLFASRYEGFGLPALEAMAFGLPVLASTAPAVLVVTDGAALHVDPLRHDDLVDKIRALDGDHALRERLVRAGAERVAQFSWDAAARTMLDIYREAVT